MPKRIHIALPDDHPVAARLRASLIPGGDLVPVASIADGIPQADVVVASSSTAVSLPQSLPPSVQLLQLIDCGAAQRYAGATGLTVANASITLAPAAASRATEHIARAIERRASRQSTSLLQLGIIGCGTLATALIPHLRQQFGESTGIVWVADIRTPRQQLLAQLDVRRSTLDLLLSRSDIVLIAVHPGPTADPLLGPRELRLLPTGAAVIDLASAPVVAPPDARHAPWINTLHITPTDPSAHERDAVACAEGVATLVAENIRAFANATPVSSVVEHVDFPHAGDPAFWSSRMDPTRP